MESHWSNRGFTSQWDILKKKTPYFDATSTISSGSPARNPLRFRSPAGAENTQVVRSDGG